MCDQRAEKKCAEWLFKTSEVKDSFKLPNKGGLESVDDPRARKKQLLNDPLNLQK